MGSGLFRSALLCLILRQPMLCYFDASFLRFNNNIFGSCLSATAKKFITNHWNGIGNCYSKMLFNWNKNNKTVYAFNLNSFRKHTTHNIDTWWFLYIIHSFIHCFVAVTVNALPKHDNIANEHCASDVISFPKNFGETTDHTSSSDIHKYVWMGWQRKVGKAPKTMAEQPFYGTRIFKECTIVASTLPKYWRRENVQIFLDILHRFSINEN